MYFFLDEILLCRRYNSGAYHINVLFLLKYALVRNIFLSLKWTQLIYEKFFLFN